MEIFGRKVETYHIRSSPVACVYVKQKDGDCPKKRDPKYNCIDNCGGNFVIARYNDIIPVSVFGLAFEELQIDDPNLNPSVYSLRNHRIALNLPQKNACVKSLEDMKVLAEMSEYELQVGEKQCSFLYRNSEQVAVFYPCYLAYNTSAELFLPEAINTLMEVHANLGRIFGEARECGAEIFLQDPITGPCIREGDPRTLEMIRELGGEDTMRIIKEIKKHM